MAVEEIRIQIKRVRSSAAPLGLPAYMTEGSAGMDLCADIQGEIKLAPLERKLIPTGIAIALPAGFEAQIRSRSGLALKQGVTMVNSPGTIDSDYRGEVGCVVINLGQDPFVIKDGDRIAQLVIHQVSRAELEETAELPESSRGEGGFGHTGR